jgi:tRNA modification GTPase
VKPDVIAAIATAPGRAAVGVVRISGSDLKSMMAGLFGRALSPRQATFTKFLGPNGVAIDSGIGLYFPAPRSYTGEDVLELQGHGGDGVLKIVLERCLEMGARLAEPGEFTRRAFLNGKLDLAQAEAVADLIEASSKAAALAAVRSLTGALSSAVNELNQSLLSLRTRIEAQIDFPEEGIEADDQSQFREELRSAELRTKDLLGRAVQGQQLREGIKVALVGAPNVGKSSLLNYLAGDAIAIVTEVPGTTRDAIAVEVSIEGISVTLTDTAGIRSTQDEIERIGVRRALKTAEQADLLIVVHDVTVGIQERQSDLSLPETIPRIPVFNKADLISAPRAQNSPALYISAKTGLGIEKLRRMIVEKAGVTAFSESNFSARQRHIFALEEALEHVRRSQFLESTELVAEELRLAGYALGAITGKITPDELLGQIFSTFCIGK